MGDTWGHGERDTHGDADAYRQRYAHGYPHPHRHANLDAFTDCNTHGDPDRGTTHAAAHAVGHGLRPAPLPGDGDGARCEALTDADAGLCTFANRDACPYPDGHPQARRRVVAPTADEYVRTAPPAAAHRNIATTAHIDAAPSANTSLDHSGRGGTLGPVQADEAMRDPSHWQRALPSLPDCFYTVFRQRRDL